MEAKSIGGYFELELPYGNALYFGDDYIELNSARNCLEYLLKFEKFTKIYIPYYTCDAVLEPIKKLEISYEFYDIDDNLEPTFDYKTLKESDVFLYTNYFGVKDLFIKSKLRSVSKI